MVRIVVKPVRHGSKGTRYRAQFEDGETLLESARTPFFDGARELLKRGYDPGAVLEMRHEGSATIALRQTIGKAAVLAVLENDKRGPEIVPWKPFAMSPFEGYSPKVEEEGGSGVP